MSTTKILKLGGFSKGPLRSRSTTRTLALNLWHVFPMHNRKSSAKYPEKAKQTMANRVLLLEGYEQIKGVDDEHERTCGCEDMDVNVMYSGDAFDLLGL